MISGAQFTEYGFSLFRSVLFKRRRELEEISLRSTGDEIEEEIERVERLLMKLSSAQIETHRRERDERRTR